jgi:hypothetical protein
LLEIFSYFKQIKLVGELGFKIKTLKLDETGGGAAVFKINLSALPTLEIG